MRGKRPCSPLSLSLIEQDVTAGQGPAHPSLSLTSWTVHSFSEMDILFRLFRVAAEVVSYVRTRDHDRCLCGPWKPFPSRNAHRSSTNKRQARSESVATASRKRTKKWWLRLWHRSIHPPLPSWMLHDCTHNTAPPAPPPVLCSFWSTLHKMFLSTLSAGRAYVNLCANNHVAAAGTETCAWRRSRTFTTLSKRTTRRWRGLPSPGRRRPSPTRRPRTPATTASSEGASSSGGRAAGAPAAIPCVRGSAT